MKILFVEDEAGLLLGMLKEAPAGRAVDDLAEEGVADERGRRHGLALGNGVGI